MSKQSMKHAAKAPAKQPAHRSGRPRGGQLIADRAALLAAAERAVRAHGPDVTMEAIAAEAAVTKPILYRAVGDKDAVATALAERFVDRINAAGALAIKEAAGGRDGLRRLIGSFIEVVEQDRHLFLFVTDAGSNEDRTGLVLRLADRSARPIAHDLAARRAAGLDPTVALMWAYGIIGTLHFVTLWWLRDQTASATEIADHLTELLWSGISGAAEPAPRQGSARSARA